MTDHTNAAAAFAGFPPTPEQRAMLAQTQVTPAPVLRLHLPASASAADVREALARLATRHEVLRYRLQHVPGYREVRLRASDAAIGLEELDVADDAGVQLQISRDQLRRFDAPDQPLLQARLLRRTDGKPENVLLLCCAPLIADRLTLLTLAQDFHRLLAQPGSLPVGAEEELFQFGQFSEWREELANSEDAAAALAYWNDHLQAPAQSPPLSWRRIGNEVSDVRAVALPVPATLAGALNSFCQAGNVQAENLLHAAWLVLLARQTQSGEAQDDRAHLSGWQHDCRRDYDMLKGAVGRFDKVLPLAMRVDTDLAFSVVVQQLEVVKQHHRDMQEHAPADHATRPVIGFAGAVDAVRAGLAHHAGWRFVVDHAALRRASLRCCRRPRLARPISDPARRSAGATAAGSRLARRARRRDARALAGIRGRHHYHRCDRDRRCHDRRMGAAHSRGSRADRRSTTHHLCRTGAARRCTGLCLGQARRGARQYRRFAIAALCRAGAGLAGGLACRRRLSAAGAGRPVGASRRDPQGRRCGLADRLGRQRRACVSVSGLERVAAAGRARRTGGRGAA